ncbi:hypothetical protein MANES_17G079240v8 [Manihot esculenta]|uniref:Uncharacterized protein n=1 Tax=Manihot esculenta TaxID=3983 RepID=A0ACB7G3X9_MANES|nr:hypothetical protein MANES_17G079240v8 [Manihot esculenta]
MTLWGKLEIHFWIDAQISFMMSSVPDHTLYPICPLTKFLVLIFLKVNGVRKALLSAENISMMGLLPWLRI